MQSSLFFTETKRELCESIETICNFFGAAFDEKEMSLPGWRFQRFFQRSDLFVVVVADVPILCQKLQCIPRELGATFVPLRNFCSGLRRGCVASLRLGLLLGGSFVIFYLFVVVLLFFGVFVGFCWCLFVFVGFFCWFFLLVVVGFCLCLWVFVGLVVVVVVVFVGFCAFFVVGLVFVVVDLVLVVDLVFVDVDFVFVGLELQGVGTGATPVAARAANLPANSSV